LGFCGTIIPPSVSTLIYTPALKQLVFPITYNSSFDGISTGVMLVTSSQPPIDSIKLVQTVAYESIIDGWGTLITPAGSYNALRQKMTRTQTDSTYIHMNGSWSLSPSPIQTTSSINYEWQGKNSPFLATLVTDENGNVTAVSWLTNVPSGIEDNLIHTTDIYPNPTGGMIALYTAMEDLSEIEICSLTGQQLLHYSGQKAGENQQLDLSVLAPGMYFLILRQGEISVTKKIVIQ